MEKRKNSFPYDNTKKKYVDNNRKSRYIMIIARIAKENLENEKKKLHPVIRIEGKKKWRKKSKYIYY